MKYILALAAVVVLTACPRDDQPVMETDPGMAPAPVVTDPMYDTLYRDTLYRDTLPGQPGVRPGQPTP
jgi:uncharacterized protein YcgI (DUF1989 family)